MFKKIAAYLLVACMALGAAFAYAADGKSFTTSGATGGGNCCGSLTTDHD